MKIGAEEIAQAMHGYAQAGVGHVCSTWRRTDESRSTGWKDLYTFIVKFQVRISLYKQADRI